MRFDSLERLIERLFAGHGETADEADAGETAFLAAALSGVETAGGMPAGDPSEPLAAYLDGALDSEARHTFEAGLAHSPGEREDLEAARAFLDAVGDRALAAPPDLVEAMVAGLASDPVEARERRFWQRTLAWIWARPRTIGVLGGTVAVAFSVILMVSANLDETVAPFKSAVPPGAHVAKSPRSVVPAPEPVPPPKPETVIAPQANPPPVASQAGQALPAANDAASSLEQLQNEEMGELGAKRDATEEAGAADDPCAHNRSSSKDAATTKTGTTSSNDDSQNCDKNFADHGVASQPALGSTPSAADAMPAETAPDATGNAIPSPQPDTPPH